MEDMVDRCYISFPQAPATRVSQRTQSQMTVPFLARTTQRDVTPSSPP